jgi:hypothetical protein
MEYRKGIDSRVEGIRVQAEKYQAAIFISAIDERNICGIHSEPPKNVNRMFLSIVPCTKEEAEKFITVWKEFYQKTQKN